MSAASVRSRTRTEHPHRCCESPAPGAASAMRSSSAIAAMPARRARAADAGLEAFVALRLRARQPARLAPGVVAARRRLPPAAEGRAPHADARDPRVVAPRSGRSCPEAPGHDADRRASAAGCSTDPAQPVSFSFDGRALRGLPATRWPRRCSPTACAWSAAASSTTARAASSPAGREEPCALVDVLGAAGPRTERAGDHAAAATRASCAESQNRWPSLRFDLLARQRPARPLPARRVSTTRPSCRRAGPGSASTSR